MNEDSHNHVDRVLNIVSLFNILRVPKDAVLLRVFPFTLTEAAKRWVDRLTPGAINIWDLLKKTFIQRNISSSSNTDGLTASVRPHLNKEGPLNEEVKLVEEVKYGEFRTNIGAPSLPTEQCKMVNVDHVIPHKPVSSSASVNVMPKNIFDYLRLANLRNINMLVEMADMKKKEPLEALDPDRNLLKRSFDDYKWVFDLEIKKLADEYELGIGKKGHILEMIWENCKKTQGKAKDWWYDYWLEDDEKQENEDKKYDPPKVYLKLLK
nr:hypothetical protein [Tanacetum cinerariifolium]